MDGNDPVRCYRIEEIRMITCRVMLMLYELEVLQSDAERIGDPVALPLTDIINNGGNSNRLETTNAHQPTTAAGSNERERLKMTCSSFFSAPPPAPPTNVIRQGAKALPTLDDRKKPNGDNNRFSSKGGNAIDKERIINIDTLNPYMNK